MEVAVSWYPGDLGLQLQGTSRLVKEMSLRRSHQQKIVARQRPSQTTTGWGCRVQGRAVPAAAAHLRAPVELVKENALRPSLQDPLMRRECSEAANAPVRSQPDRSSGPACQ